MKITGLKKIAGESKTLSGFYSGEYLQINYNKKTGETWSDHFVDLGHSWKTTYHDPDIIHCGVIYEHVTMKDIREKIEAVA